MERLIRVELKDGSICCMAKKAFYIFLAQSKVVKYERSDGWVNRTRFSRHSLVVENIVSQMLPGTDHYYSHDAV